MQTWPKVGLKWECGSTTGWGILNLHLALHFAARGIMPVWFVPPDLRGINAIRRQILEPARQLHEQVKVQLANHTRIDVDIPVLCAVGNDFTQGALRFAVNGRPDIGLMFFENSDFTAAGIERSKAFAKIIVGSTWNAQILRALGLSNISVVMQGVDPTLFHPAPKSGLLGDRFVIFSGGKLEYRKGQDIVVAAVREFQKRHPETLLMVAWHNPWPNSIREITHGGLVDGVPQIVNGEIDFSNWLRRQGIGNSIDLGQLLHSQIPPLIREADVALFPNRCEGGTNLVAMECLACGVPTILSANTGHLDLISEETCYPLRKQGLVKASQLYPAVREWGESDVGEIVETLERIHGDRVESRRRAAAGARAMEKLTLANFAARVLEEIPQ
jgi:glycosyltransferase involved in cell wall biosynthesis